MNAAIEVIADVGWHDLTIERIAARAKLSRVTIWRQGISKEVVVDALLHRLARDYRDAMWPTLTAPGTARDRLKLAISALCKLAEANLALLRTSDAVFHQASDRRGADTLGFSEPFARLVEDGARDGTLTFFATPKKTGALLFNLVCYTYIHLRGRHGWSSQQVPRLLTELILDGIAQR